MKELLFLASVLSIVGLAWAALRSPCDYVFRGPNGLLLGLERLESDPYGMHVVRCKAFPQLDGVTAPLLVLMDRLQKAGFHPC